MSGYVYRGISAEEKRRTDLHLKQAHEQIQALKAALDDAYDELDALRECFHAAHHASLEVEARYHGITGYKKGCRCPICRQAARESNRRKYQNKKAREQS